MAQHQSPVVFFRKLSRRGEGDHPSRTSANPANEWQAHHPRTEPAMSARSFGATEDFNQRLACWLEAKRARQLRQCLLFQVARGIAPQQFILASVEFHNEMLGLDRRIILQNVENLEHVLDPYIERINRKRLGE